MSQVFQESLRYNGFLFVLEFRSHSCLSALNVKDYTRWDRPLTSLDEQLPFWSVHAPFANEATAWGKYTYFLQPYVRLCERWRALSRQLIEKEMSLDMYHHLIASLISSRYAASRAFFSPVTSSVLNRNGTRDDSEKIAYRNVQGFVSWLWRLLYTAEWPSRYSRPKVGYSTSSLNHSTEKA